MKYVLMGLILAVMAVSGTAGADVLIVLNQEVTETSIDSNQLKEIFLGKRLKWSDNSKIILVTLKSSPAHKAFLKNYIKRTESQFKVHWKKMLFTGKGKLPKSFDTSEELIKFVASTKGAIGYVDQSADVSTVKTINVNN